MIHEENWNKFIEELRAYVLEHRHEFDRLTTGFLNKHTNLLSRVKYIRKKINDGTLEEWKYAVNPYGDGKACGRIADALAGREVERYL